jgi:DNA gyrase subunit A
MALRSGRAIRFNEKDVRPMGRNASGVRGVMLKDSEDEVIGMICMENNQFDILVVSENGYGKRSKLDDYRITKRGGKGVKTLNITDKTGKLISIDSVTDKDDLMIINRSGLIIRMAVSDLRVMGRATQGVRLISLRDNDQIAAVTKVEEDPADKELLESEISEFEENNGTATFEKSIDLETISEEEEIADELDDEEDIDEELIEEDEEEEEGEELFDDDEELLDDEDEIS